MRWLEKIKYRKNNEKILKKNEKQIGITMIIISIFFLTGCNQLETTINPEKNRFIGTWKTTDEIFGNLTITFLSDGTYSGPMISDGTWRLQDNKLIIHGTIGDITTITIYTYQFFNNNTILKTISTDNQQNTYMKQN